MFAEDLVTHCNQSCHQHLTLAVELIGTQQAALEEQSVQIGGLEGALASARDEIRTTAAALAALQAGTCVNLSKDSKKMSKQVGALTKENKKMAKQMADILKQMKTLA